MKDELMNNRSESNNRDKTDFLFAGKAKGSIDEDVKALHMCD